MSLNLPPIPTDPIQESPIWRNWFSRVQQLFTSKVSGSIPVSHNALSDIQGGTSDERNHLSNAQVTKLTNIEDGAEVNNISDTDAIDLTDGGETVLHLHDYEHVTWPSSLIVGGATHVTELQGAINHMWSAGMVDGGALTDNGDGTVTIAEGTAVIHATSNPHTDLYEVIVPASTPTLTDGSANYIYVDYNSGTPQYAVSTDITSFNCIDKCIIYLAHRSGTVVHWIDAREQNVDSNRKIRRLFLGFSKFIHDENGTAIGANGLAITVTAGKFNFMVQELPHDAFDTSVAGTANVNVFTLWYQDGVGGWTETINSKTITTTTYDDGSGTPATLNNNKYGVTWFYIMNNSPSELHAVMGQVEYANLSDAEVAAPPTNVPPILSSLGSLIGYVIYEKSAVAFDDVRSVFTQQFTSSAATVHNGLSGLQGGTVAEYYHLTSAEYTGTGSGSFVRDTSPTLTTPQISGTLGIGNTAISSIGVRISSLVLLSGAAAQYGNNNNVTFGSDCTTAGYSFYARPSTTAATYTMGNLINYRANGFIKGAGSTVTTYTSFWADDETDAGTHYAFYGQQSAVNASDRNCYITGSAPNYFAAAVMVGSNTNDGVNLLQVTGSIKSTTTIETGGYIVSTLPAGTQGQRAFVTDATAPTWLATLTGGGAVVCPAFHDGVNWVSA